MNNNAPQFQAAPSLVLQFMVPIENLSQSNKIVLRQVENVCYHVRTRRRNTQSFKMIEGDWGSRKYVSTLEDVNMFLLLSLMAFLLTAIKKSVTEFRIIEPHNPHIGGRFHKQSTNNRQVNSSLMAQAHDLFHFSWFCRATTIGAKQTKPE